MKSVIASALVSSGLAIAAMSDFRSAILAEQTVSISCPHHRKHIADLSNRSVAVTPPGKKTAYGSLILPRDPKTRLFWWQLLPNDRPFTLDEARAEAAELAFVSNDAQLVCFRLAGRSLAARSSDLHPPSLDAGQNQVRKEIETQLTTTWPSTSFAPPQNYVQYDLVGLLGPGFVFTGTDSRPTFPVSISRTAWERRRWVVELRNDIGDIGRIEISFALRVLRAELNPGPKRTER